MVQAVFAQEGDRLDYRPQADVSAGQVIVLGDTVAVATRDIKAGTLGALAVEGGFDVVKGSGAIGDGVSVYWDTDGNPVGGVAGSGCATATATGNTYMGYEGQGGAGETDATVRVILEQAPPAPVTPPAGGGE